MWLQSAQVHVTLNGGRVRRGGGAQRALGTMWRHARVTPEAAKKVLLLSQRVTQLQLCLYLSVERFRGGRLKGWGPAGRRAVAEARCDNGRKQEHGSRTWRERRERKVSVCASALRRSNVLDAPVSKTLCLFLSLCLSIYIHTHIWAYIYVIFI